MSIPFPICLLTSQQREETMHVVNTTCSKTSGCKDRCESMTCRSPSLIESIAFGLNSEDGGWICVLLTSLPSTYIEVILHIGYWMCEGKDDGKQGLILFEPLFLGCSVLVHPWSVSNFILGTIAARQWWLLLGVLALAGMCLGPFTWMYIEESKVSVNCTVYGKQRKDHDHILLHIQHVLEDISHQQSLHGWLLGGSQWHILPPLQPIQCSLHLCLHCHCPPRAQRNLHHHLGVCHLLLQTLFHPHHHCHHAVHLAGNVGICVCRLHPPNERHLCLLPICPQCQPNTLATFC